MINSAKRLDANKWHDLYPDLGTGPIPIEPYVSRAHFEKERDLLFRKLWLNVGRVEQVPEVDVGGGLKMVQIGRYERVEGFAVLAPAMMSGLGRRRSALESTRSDLDLVF